MIKKGYLKPEISIELIGKKKFWLGIIMGIAYSLMLSYFLNYCRESLRFITFFADPYILAPNNSIKYDLFFAFLSASIGFGITIVFWFLGHNKNIARTHLKRFAITNALFISIVVLMIVSRFGSLLPIILYGRGFDGQLQIFEDYKLLLILTPFFVFFGNWNAVRAFLRTRYWILISFVLYCLFSLFVYKTTTLDKDVLNDYYYQQNKERLDFIDKEFRKAVRMDIAFPERMRTTLQKRYSRKTQALVMDLKETFSSERKVTIDTLILEKIVIHNLNQHGRFYSQWKGEDINLNWPYALPEHVYAQIQLNEVGSPEMLLLFEILQEQTNIFNAEEYNWEYYETYTPYERELASYKYNISLSTNTILSRLMQVVNELKAEERYVQYHHLLPYIAFEDKRGRQKHYELNL